MKQNVSIIILNWNGWQDTLECLESLYDIDYPDYNVIVVDNGSKDESIEMIKKYASGELEVESNFFEFNRYNKPIKIFEYEAEDLKSLPKASMEYNGLDSNRKLILIKNDYNSGFSEGNNIGITFSLEILMPEYILLLNNDTVVDRIFLDELVKYASTNPKIGIVGPEVLYYDKPDKTALIGNEVNLCNGKITHSLKKMEYPSKPVEIGFVVGCGLLVKKSVIEDIGMLDPNYFLYYEDVDWCLRAKKQGYKIFYLPMSKLWHKISSEDKRSLASYYYGNRNSFLLVKKNRTSNDIFYCYLILIINKSIFAFYLLIIGNSKESSAVINGVYDAFKGNYGYKKLG